MLPTALLVWLLAAFPLCLSDVYARAIPATEDYIEPEENYLEEESEEEKTGIEVKKKETEECTTPSTTECVTKSTTPTTTKCVVSKSTKPSTTQCVTKSTTPTTTTCVVTKSTTSSTTECVPKTTTKCVSKTTKCVSKQKSIPGDTSKETSEETDDSEGDYEEAYTPVEESNELEDAEIEAKGDLMEDEEWDEIYGPAVEDLDANEEPGKENKARPRKNTADNDIRWEGPCSEFGKSSASFLSSCRVWSLLRGVLLVLASVVL